MTDNVSFRSSFNGFNREDVVGYIAGLMEKIGAAERNAEEYRRLAAEKDQAAEALRKQCDELEEENGKLSDRCEEVEERCGELSERISLMEQRLSEYDKLSQKNEVKLGAAMMDAKRFSEMLVKEANDRAGEVYHQAELSVTDSTAEAREIKEQMKVLADEFDRNMGAMRKNMNELIDRMTGFNEEIKDNGAKFLYRSEFTDGNDD